MQVDAPDYKSLSFPSFLLMSRKRFLQFETVESLCGKNTLLWNGVAGETGEGSETLSFSRASCFASPALIIVFFSMVKWGKWFRLVDLRKHQSIIYFMHQLQV